MSRPKSIENDALLRIAREVFLESGAFGSTKEIAKRAKLSEAALFKRFSTKAELFVAAMAPPAADTDAILLRARAEKDPRRALQQLTRSVLAYYRSALPSILHLITHPAIGIGALHDRLGHPQPLDLAIAGFLKEQQAAGRIHAPNVQAAAMMLVTALHSVVLFELMGVHGGSVSDAQLSAMTDVLWTGLRPTPSKPVRRTR